MDYNQLLRKHATVPFVVDGKDELGVYMILDSYRLHVRKDDVPLAQGLPLQDIWPLINEIRRAESP